MVGKPQTGRVLKIKGPYLLTPFLYYKQVISNDNQRPSLFGIREWLGDKQYTSFPHDAHDAVIGHDVRMYYYELWHTTYIAVLIKK